MAEGGLAMKPSRNVGRTSRRLGIILGAILCLCPARLASPLAAQSPSIFRSEFWAELPSMPASVQGDPAGTARAILLADAAYVFAGEIWGFSFDWTPQDNARSIAESFSLSPLGMIEAGSAQLMPEAERREGTRLFAYVSYAADGSELMLAGAHAHSPWKSGQGTGKAVWKEDFGSRKAAYAEAARAAVRELLRGEEANKPRRVRGSIAFAAPPRIWIADGLYVVQARFKVEVVELSSYEVY